MCDRRCWTAPCGCCGHNLSAAVCLCVTGAAGQLRMALYGCCGRLCLSAAVCLCVTGAAGQLRVAAAAIIYQQLCVYV